MDKLLEDLIKELKRRQEANPKYSMRAYARDLEIDQSLLSRILKGQRAISLKVRISLEQKLGSTQS